ncbi:hypothetical protein [Pseudodesulfovibrio sediminis]|uniref:Uncharacterized protein n=1 Tax=Pseudodesulfovibrio sediminis TaxID=2810563 RepID=A0ABN6EVL0_9BACT|nr:hypothetical protein [Pseudodesulfovibrio sediminis]BCS89553.1 hypothetical protein PSDVSF_27950 [Pseudodesulfovibrio sediminis]
MVVRLKNRQIKNVKTETISRYFGKVRRCLEVSAEDVVAFVTLTTVVLFAVRQILIINGLKSIGISKSMRYFIESDKVIVDYWNLFSSITMLAMIASLLVCFVFGLLFCQVKKKSSSIEFFFNKKENFKYLMGGIACFVVLFAWQKAIVSLLVILASTYMFKMRVLVRYAIINALMMFAVTGYLSPSIPKDVVAANKNGNDIIQLTLQRGYAQNASIIASSSDWVLFDIEGREILVPSTSIVKIDLGEVFDVKK